MPEISLPRKVIGRELTDVIKSVAGEMWLDCYDLKDGLFVRKEFSDHEAEKKWGYRFGAVPHLEFNFGKIDPQRNYATLQCETLTGIDRRYASTSWQPTKFEGSEAKFKQYYVDFIEQVTQHLQ